MVKNQEQKRIYLACPYSRNNQRIRFERYDLATRIAAVLIKEGHSVFSPITQEHQICEHGIEHDCDTWENINLSMIELWATDVYMLMVQGWDDSEQIIEAAMQAASVAKIPFRFFPHADIESMLNEAHLTPPMVKKEEQKRIYTNDDMTSILSKYETMIEFCSKIDRGRGVWKRIDENRELLQCLQEHAPELLEKFSFIETWIAQQDIFLVILTQILQLKTDLGFKPQPFPRPWTGSFPLDNAYQAYQEFLEYVVLGK